MISFLYILGFSLGCFLRNNGFGRTKFRTYKIMYVRNHKKEPLQPLGTPIFQQYNIFGVEKQAYVHLVALI